MAAVQTRGNKTGNFLKKEFWPEEFYCRENITVTKAGLAVENSPGEIVYAATQGATTYGVVPDGALAAPGTGKVAVIVDPDVDDKIAAAGATMVVAALVRGPVVLRKGGLGYTGTATFANIESLLKYQGFTLAANFSITAQS